MVIFFFKPQQCYELGTRLKEKQPPTVSAMVSDDKIPIKTLLPPMCQLCC